MMFGNYGGYGMMGAGTGVVGTITLVLVWVLLIVGIAALWTYIQKNK